MSTPDSRRLRLSLLALAMVGLVYLADVAALQAVARRAESSGQVYPYRDEDWFRYLVPALWPTRGRPSMLLTGPSTVRENLLVEEFQAAFPGYRVFQGALSGGTLGDVMASLAYVERAYGPHALPKVIVLGVSTRFLAEIPPRRGFGTTLMRYSPYRVPGDRPQGFELQEKPVQSALLAQARFLTVKQKSRYLTSLRWMAASLCRPECSAAISRSRFAHSGVARVLGFGEALSTGPHEYYRAQVSPYKYRNAIPQTEHFLAQWMDDSASVWRRIHRWNPSQEDGGVRRRVAELLDFVARHDIELYAVNLPERSLSIRRYTAAATRGYDELLRSAFASVPLLDLRSLLADDEYYDTEHPRPPGARRTTEQVLSFLRSMRSARASAAATPAERVSAPVLSGQAP